MDIYYKARELMRKFKNPVVAIGVFDGMHEGHQKLIELALKRARLIRGTAMVMTFDPHPVHLLRPQKELPLVISLSYRLKLIEQLGIQAVFVVRFTRRFSQLSPQSFIKRYLVDYLKVREVIVGDDFRFGQNRTGTIPSFQEEGKRYGFKVHAIAAVKKGQTIISSTRIRKLISEGQISKASSLLHRPVALMGRVESGDRRGQTLGFPTANLKVHDVVLPPLGVYLVRVKVDGKTYRGIANIGRRPSFKNHDRVNLEVHIFQFKHNLYGKEIIVELITRIRPEKRFENRADLINQINRDIVKAKAMFDHRSLHSASAVMR